MDKTRHNLQPSGEEGVDRLLDQVTQKLDEARALLDRVGRLPPDAPQPADESRPLRYLVFSKGGKRIATEQEVLALAPEKFHFFLDLAQGRLLTKVGARRAKVRSIAGSGLQSEDVTTLAFLVEHANQYFGADNLAQFLDGQEMLTPDTLNRRLVRIRRAVQQGQLDGPFILKVSNVDPSVSRTGFGYYFDGAASPYCLVRFARPNER